MDNNFIKIKPVEIPHFGGSETANAITWKCSELTRNSTSARLFCQLLRVNEQDQIMPVKPLYTFTMDVPNDILQTWGDDSVIDDFVLTYSDKFEKEVTP